MERREARRDGQVGAAIVVPERRMGMVVLVLLVVLQFVGVGEEAVAAALLVAGEAEKLVEGLAVHVVGGGGGEGGADERGEGKVESVGGLHRAAPPPPTWVRVLSLSFVWAVSSV